MADQAASVIAKLKNKSKEQGVPLQQLLNLFCQEEFIRRLARSTYKNQLILKGGFLLYTISHFTTRPTVDADYLLKNHSNDQTEVEKMITRIIQDGGENEFVQLEIRNTEIISENKNYHGIRANLVGSIGKTKTPFSIDFGIGDVIVPSAITRTLPVLITDFEEPEVLTYSLESTIAEKIDAIIVMMELTGRMKDFYDIYYLATTFDFEGRKLQEAIYDTLTNRGTPYERDSILAINNLIDNHQIQQRWSVFCKKVLKFEIELHTVIQTITDLLQPPFEAIVNESEFFGMWNADEHKYIS
ncbi:MAG: nucleotidyl transferase AbiEii/AbiGii toxin family protein [Bacillaceae bacterium]|nr:nucleotidyl transferase AbiEii/AbiGii toxin family protein [Bacillaceae bacterium]